MAIQSKLMAMKKYLMITVIFFCQLICGCRSQRTVDTMTIGSNKLIIDGSSGTVKIFRVNSAGGRVELYDTGAAQRLGWSVLRVNSDRLKLTTKDVGGFDICVDGMDCLVVPSGTFLSASRKAAVKLFQEAGTVKAKIGETSFPYTDLWVSDERTITSMKLEQFSVRWTGDSIADVVDGSGRTVVTLRITGDGPAATEPDSK